MDLSENIFKIEYNLEYPAAGKLLVAEPFMVEYPFSRSIVLLISHSGEGSIGIILNMPILHVLNSAVPELKDLDPIPLYKGGPLGEDILFFIHSYGDLPQALPIKNGLYLNGDFEFVKQKLLEGKMSPDDFKFFLGYSGWGPNQLEMELNIDTWVVTEEPSEYVLNQNTETLWSDVLSNMGAKYKVWSRYPLMPSHN